MSRIRSRGNRDTELALVGFLRAYRIKGWRRHTSIFIRSNQREEALTPNPKSEIRHPKLIRASSPRLLQVRPDFVFPRRRLAVFVDGCFWHACPLHATKPRSNAAYWRKKLAANRARDRKVNRTLRAAGWRVLRIWEHELEKGGRRKAERGEKRLLTRLRKALGRPSADCRLPIAEGRYARSAAPKRSELRLARRADLWQCPACAAQAPPVGR